MIAPQSDNMPTQEGLSSESQERLAELLDIYLQSLEKGRPLDPDQLAARHPELAEPLREYLDGLRWLHDGADEFRALPADLDVPEDDAPRCLGDYQIIREVGRGGMGIVYEARQMSLDRQVALKVLPFAAVLDQKQIQRFQNEARAAAQLQHPNIVPIHGVGNDRGVHFYAMQFIEGQSLSQVLYQLQDDAGIPGMSPGSEHKGNDASRPKDTGDTASCERMPPASCGAFPATRSGAQHCRAAACLGIQAAEALHSAHECGVIHRDVKPSNLILDREGKLWVTDFGLARFHRNESCTQSGDIVGTLQYMSPEQAHGDSALIDPRTDCYSLGITLYEMLTLHRAFEGDVYADVLQKIDAGDCPRMQKLNPQIPRDLVNVVYKAMAVERAERYASLQELADDLQRYVDGKPTHAKPPSIPQRLGKWGRRHRTAVSAAVAVLLVGFFGLAASTMVIYHKQQQTDEALDQSQATLELAQEAIKDLGAEAADLYDNYPARNELLQKILDYHTKLLAMNANGASLATEAATYAEIAWLHQEMGENENALRAYEYAASRYETLMESSSAAARYRAQWMRCLENVAMAERRAGELKRAQQTVHRIIDMLGSQVDGLPESQVELALAHNNLGLILADSGRLDDAARHYQTSIDSLKRMRSGNAVLSPRALETLGSTCNNLGQLRRQQNAADAESWVQQAVDAFQGLAAAEPDNIAYAAKLANAYNNLAGVKTREDAHAEALEAYDRAIEIQRALVLRDSMKLQWKRDLAVSLNNSGLLASRRRADGDAEVRFREALRMQMDIVKMMPDNVANVSYLGGMHNNLAMVLVRERRSLDAARQYDRAVDCQRYAHQKSPDNAAFRDRYSKTLVNYGDLLRRIRRPSQALEAAVARRDLWSVDPRKLLSVANDLARIRETAMRTGGIDQSTAERIVEEGKRTLDLAFAAGWRPDEEFRKSEAFGSFRYEPAGA